MKPDFSIIIPAYNEADGLPFLKETLEDYLNTITMSLQFVFVDDGSRDETYSNLCSWTFKNAQIKLVKLSKNFGSHSAIRAGILHADADRVMVYSADMPEPVSDITLFFEELCKGYEIVYSERIGYEGSFGSRVYNKLTNKYIEASYPANGLIGVAFGPKVKCELNRAIEVNSSIFFQIFSLGFSKKSIPIQYCEREIGSSKWTLKKKIVHFIDSFVGFSYAPIRAISLMGIFMSFVGVVGAFLIVLFKLLNIVEFAAGWPTMISILLLGFGVTNMSLGVIAEYVGRTLEATQNKPVFMVDEIMEINSEN